MYYATSQFKKCMRESLRNRAYIKVSIGVINLLAQSNGEITSKLTDWSNERSVWQENTVGSQYVTFEQNQWKADGSQLLLPESGVDLAVYNTDTGVITKDILGSITINFGKQYDLKGLTVRFGEFYPTEFTITVDGGTYTYTNESEVFETSDTFGLTASMIITPVTMVGGQQRLRIEELTMGVGFSFTNDVIQKVTTSADVSFISSKISGNSFNLTAIDLEDNFNVDDTNSYINYLETGQQIDCAVGMDLDDGSIEWIPLGVYHLKTWSKEGMYVKLTGNNILSMLTDTYSDGNYIHTRTLYDDFIALMQFAGLEPDQYNVDDTLQDITVTNPFPSVPINQGCQLIANAGRCVCYEDRYGVIQMKANFALVLNPDDMHISTSDATEYSHPENIVVGTNDVYADFTRNFFSADGSMYLLPESGNDYLDTGFVSQKISNRVGSFTDNILTRPYYRESNWGNPVTKNGLTFTVNDDGSIKVKGTATSTFDYHFTLRTASSLHLPSGNYRIANFGDVSTSTAPFTIFFNGTSASDSTSLSIGALRNASYVDCVLDSSLLTYDSSNGCGIGMHFTSGKTYNCTIKPMLINLDWCDNIPTEFAIEDYPTIQLDMPASFSYYGINVNFDGNPPTEMIIRTYNNDELVSEETYTDLDNEQYIPYTFTSFDKLILSFTKTEPRNRVLVSKVSFSDLSDYKLSFDDIIDNVKGVKENNIKTVKVKRYTFIEPETEGELPQQKNDDVWYDVSVLTSGDEAKVTNQLISTEEHARLVAEWIGNYYSNNVSYSCKFRGDPTLDATDIIYLDSNILETLQVEIEKHTFTFNGAFGGTLEMRRITREQ